VAEVGALQYAARIGFATNPTPDQTLTLHPTNLYPPPVSEYGLVVRPHWADVSLVLYHSVRQRTENRAGWDLRFP